MDIEAKLFDICFFAFTVIVCSCNSSSTPTKWSTLLSHNVRDNPLKGLNSRPSFVPLILSVRFGRTGSLQVRTSQDGRFQPVCYTGWNQSYADQACAQLGFRKYWITLLLIKYSFAQAYYNMLSDHTWNSLGGCSAECENTTIRMLITVPHLHSELSHATRSCLFCQIQFQQNLVNMRASSSNL